MRIPRIYLNGTLNLHEAVALDDAQVHRLTRVLRLREDAVVRAFNGGPAEYEGTLQRTDRQWYIVPTAEYPRDLRSSVSITLAQSITRGERMDFTLQKSVELGVARIQPILAQRCVLKAHDKRLPGRQSHWRRIVIQACEQCGRTDVPELLQPCDLQQWMADNPAAVMLRADAGTALGQLPLSGTGVSVLVGPEGGFSDAELRTADALGLASAHLGPRTLRTETTALVALTLLQARFGDL